MLHLSSILLAATIVAAAYITNVCSTSPNPPPPVENRHETDSLNSLLGAFNTCLRRIMFFITIYHAILSALSESANFQRLCPCMENNNPAFFSWSINAIIPLAMIFVGGAIRISAFRGLGKNFTFHLAAPDRFIETGLYRYMQHPSYTGWFFLTIGVYSLFMRWDAALGCLVPSGWLARVNGWGFWVTVAVLARFANNLRVRVHDEEEMLRRAFGKEWEKWHASTSRFIPGIW